MGREACDWKGRIVEMISGMSLEDYLSILSSSCHLATPFRPLIFPPS